MRTLLSRFCDEFVDIIRPLRVPLRRVNEAITKIDDAPGGGLQPQLADLQAQIDQLTDKVAEQQAYVLIFGPLKSGKSTLMNSIAKSYVSEVSSLPAYPCMVFVSHATKREYAVTSYDGKEQTFQDPVALQKHVDDAHTILADHIRKAEQDGTSFDPQQDLPSAIRRVDVRLPAPALSTAKAVLVDTPGLYSRMKFGYDRMTRDFRNAAACAVFVVRSDNLFLEQVFAEFNKLLELFSRIFLVINLDSTKRDLAPDGKLVPSLEQRDPQKVVQAFETLAMSAPLKRALDEGRLRLYPVDLLQAASKRITAGDKTQPANGFEAFFADLTSYLASPEYLRAFLGDSMRRARALLDETGQVRDLDEVRQLDRRLKEVEAEQKQLTKKLTTLQRLPQHDWNTPFDKLHQGLRPVVETHGTDVGTRVLENVRKEVDGWFASDESLHSLSKERLTSAFVVYQEEFTAAVSRELSERVLQGKAGTDLPEDFLADLRESGIDIDQIGRDAHAATDRGALIAVPPTPLRAEHVPVRRRIRDRLMLRSGSKVRGLLFGPDTSPMLRVPKEHKDTRLGNDGKTAIRKQLDAYARGFFRDTAERVSDGFLNGYRLSALTSLQRSITARESDLQSQIQRSEEKRRILQSVRVPLNELSMASDAAAKAMDALSDAYGKVDAAKLNQPLGEAETILPSRPPKSAQPTKTSTP